MGNTIFSYGFAQLKVSMNNETLMLLWQRMVKYTHFRYWRSFYLVGISKLWEMFLLCLDPVRLTFPILWCVHVTCGGAAVHMCIWGKFPSEEKLFTEKTYQCIHASWSFHRHSYQCLPQFPDEKMISSHNANCCCKNFIHYLLQKPIIKYIYPTFKSIN